MSGFIYAIYITLHHVFTLLYVVHSNLSVCQNVKSAVNFLFSVQSMDSIIEVCDDINCCISYLSIFSSEIY